MQVYGCQYDIIWEDRSANFSKVRNLIESAEIAPGSLIVLPEMFSTGFSMDVDVTAEEDRSKALAFMRELAAQKDAAVLGGLVTPGEKRGFGKNELAVVEPGGAQIARYQKNRTFRYTREFHHYEAGTEIAVFDWGGFRICPLICYDLRFPELFRRGAKRGAQLFVVIASWPEDRVEHWITLLRARAIENQAFVFAVNRIGDDPNWSYPGRSVAIDPQGVIIADAGDNEKILTADLPVGEVVDWRSEFPALLDLEI